MGWNIHTKLQRELFWGVYMGDQCLYGTPITVLGWVQLLHILQSLLYMQWIIDFSYCNCIRKFIMRAITNTIPVPECFVVRYRLV